VESQKKLMSCCKPLAGSSIKLGQPTDTLYLTEGLETALAVMQAVKAPVWACVSAKMLEAVIVPDHVKTVYIMADKDRSQAGQDSANTLAQRLLSEGKKVYVVLPDVEIPKGKKSVDWLDILIGGTE
jgi:putative DNA primase/helicase